MEEVDLADERLTLSAVPARSSGLVWIVFAWTEREEKQSFGYDVTLQDVLMNSVLEFGTSEFLAAEVE